MPTGQAPPDPEQAARQRLRESEHAETRARVYEELAADMLGRANRARGHGELPSWTTVGPRFAVAMATIVEHMGRQQGAFAISYAGPNSGWIASYEFGQEAEDSPMAGGASYGADHNLVVAVEQVAKEIS
jgi:hypothetical protein